MSRRRWLSTDTGRSAPAIALAAVALVFAGGPARAEANGFKFGEGRLHPYFELESRFDSAALAAGPAGALALDPDLLLHIRPGLKFEMPAKKVSVGLKGFLDYVLYTGALTAGTSTYSNLQGDADLSVNVNKGGQVSFEVGDHVVRSDRAVTPTVPFGVLSFFNDARVGLNISPAGGALQVDPSYHLTSEFFSPLGAGDASTLGAYGYLNHSFAVASRWKFLPKTALTLDGMFGMRTYAGGGAAGLNYFKANLGLVGLLTPHISTVLRIGWGQDISLGSFASLLAQGELGYLFSQTAQIRLGYVRNFEPVGGTFLSYSDDRVYLEGRALLGGKLTAHVRGDLDFVTFAGGRADRRVSFDVGGDYEVRQWVAASAGYALSVQSSDVPFYAGLSEFSRHEVYTRVQFIY